MISWRLLFLGSGTRPAGEAPKIPFSLAQKKKHLLAPSIPVDTLFQCTCPLLVANFQGPSVWNHPIDVDIKSSSLSLFKKEMKQHFIKVY